MISFIMHPALLIKNDPKKNIPNQKTNKFKFKSKIDKLNQQGHINKRNPIGLLNLIKFK